MALYPHPILTSILPCILTIVCKHMCTHRLLLTGMFTHTVSPPGGRDTWSFAQIPQECHGSPVRTRGAAGGPRALHPGWWSGSMGVRRVHHVWKSCVHVVELCTRCMQVRSGRAHLRLEMPMCVCVCTLCAQS